MVNNKVCGNILIKNGYLRLKRIVYWETVKKNVMNVLSIMKNVKKMLDFN